MKEGRKEAKQAILGRRRAKDEFVNEGDGEEFAAKVRAPPPHNMDYRPTRWP